GEPEKLFSMKLGAVGLTERFLRHNPPNEKELKSLQANIRAAVERPMRELIREKWDFATGTSGTILALGRIVNFNALTKTTAPKAEIALNKLAELNGMLSRLTIIERQKIPEVSSQRAEIIVAGGQILECVMRALKIKFLRPCEYALREGVIIDYLRETEAENLPPVPDVEDKRLRGVFAVGRRFGYEESHSLQIASIAEKIFDALQNIEQMPRHDRTLLSAAAILHDVGYHIAHESHHKHSLYLIKHSELTGFSAPETIIIANVARYHRGSLPKDKHFDFITLSDADKQTVWKLGAILRLADTLDRTYRNNISDIVFARNGKDILIEIISEVDCQNELETAIQKTEMFEIAFDCRIFFMRRPLAAKV
ncbi:MAG: HD domain-containing protein, partial [Pyrinomonadaceae bacterium]|nr:HD domain-containing protein [Pyrinomonadaceae bacterium]